MVEIGYVDQVDVREVWPHEAEDFTPWLENNLHLLGKALGLDLELLSTEAQVGAFRVDILAEEKESGRMAVIENQLEMTDHDHLGKLSVYAAGYDAGIAIWIATNFREEHLDAIAYHNKTSGDNVDFYGVQIDAIRIGDSLPAPQFTVVSRPANPYPSDNVRYRRFFAPLVRDLKNYEWERGKDWVENDSRSQEFKSEFSGITYNPSLDPDGHAYVTLWVNKGESTRQVFDALHSDKDNIESELADVNNGEIYFLIDDSESPSWAYISIPGPKALLDDDNDTQDAARAWMHDATIRLWEVLTPRLQEILGDQQADC